MERSPYALLNGLRPLRLLLNSAINSTAVAAVLLGCLGRGGEVVHAQFNAAYGAHARPGAPRVGPLPGTGEAGGGPLAIARGCRTAQ